jgi:hypothetical protein
MQTSTVSSPVPTAERGQAPGCARPLILRADEHENLAPLSGPGRTARQPPQTRTPSTNQRPPSHP